MLKEHCVDCNRILARIQFLKKDVLPGRFQEELTVDYVLQNLIYTVVDTQAKTARSRRIDISGRMDELTEVSGYDDFWKWIVGEREEREIGYRDGWRLECYLTACDDDVSVSISISRIYPDSPFEKLLSRLKAIAPEFVPDW